MGDINVDQLPTLSIDPFQFLVNRDMHQIAERMRLDNFCDEFNLEICVPDHVDGSPGGPFGEQCLVAPASRIPTGLQCASTVPSLLDYAMSEPNVLRKLMLSWIDCPADHAWLFGEFAGEAVQQVIQRKSKWKCTDDHAYAQWLDTHCPPEFRDVEHFHDFLRDAQERYADTRTCKRRSREREPAHMKDLRLQVRNATDEPTRKQLQSTLWRQRKLFLSRLASERDQQKVAKGGSLFKSKKLHKITKMYVSACEANPNGEITIDQELQASEVKREYDSKWGVNDIDLQQEIDYILDSNDGCGVQVSAEDVIGARDCIRRLDKVDHYGICARSIFTLFQLRAVVVCRLLTHIMCSRSVMCTILVQGRLYAKSKGAIPASKTRAILPLPSVLVLVDCILFNRWQPLLDKLYPEVPSVFFGARPKTQTLDIMHGLQGVIEKGLDRHGWAAIAQMDIRRFYDSLPVLLIYKHLLELCGELALAISLLRLHVCPVVSLGFGEARVSFATRTVGGLTGTRTAGLLGRVPVEDVVQCRHQVWEKSCFKTDEDFLALAVYIDNIFSTGCDADAAVSILVDCETHLQQRWGLSISKDSKSFLCARGCPPPKSETEEWAHTHGDTFAALGHTLADDGRIEPCLTATIASMWRSFYGNFGKTMRSAPLSDKLKLLNRAVLPIASYRMSRWPYQTNAAKRLDRTQTKMIRTLMRHQFEPGDDPATFAARRNRMAASVARRCGQWSQVWRKRVLDWSAHLNRERNHTSWAAKTLHYHGKHWLQEQRRIHATGASGSILAGRTCTRAGRGIVHRRWHDGVDVAMNS